jgi:hypothetical protein
MVCNLLIAAVALGDKGMIPILPDVSVHEPAQQAIVAWNGQEEILILATDVWADTQTTVLEVLPLPGMPRIEEAEFAAFEVVERIIRAHTPTRAMAKALGTEAKAVEVLFHERIGAHDLSVVRALDYQEFTHWVRDFLSRSRIRLEKFPEELESMIAGYLKRGCPYFVFDLIEVGIDPSSVKPILYRFSTPMLYYPMEITGLASGGSRVRLFLIAPGVPQLAGSTVPWQFRRYRGPRMEMVVIRLTEEELHQVHPLLPAFFPSLPYLTELSYEGEDLSDLWLSRFLSPKF